MLMKIAHRLEAGLVKWIFFAVMLFCLVGVGIGLSDFNALTDEAMGIFFSFAVVALLCGWLFIVFHRKDIANAKIIKNATTYQVTARVLSKASQVSGDAFSTGTGHFIAFELADRSRKSFAVDAMQNSLVVEGEVGLLTYKQNGEHLIYVDFQPSRQNPHSKPF